MKRHWARRVSALRVHRRAPCVFESRRRHNIYRQFNRKSSMKFQVLVLVACLPLVAFAEPPKLDWEIRPAPITADDGTVFHAGELTNDNAFRDETGKTVLLVDYWSADLKQRQFRTLWVGRRGGVLVNVESPGELMSIAPSAICFSRDTPDGLEITRFLLGGRRVTVSSRVFPASETIIPGGLPHNSRGFFSILVESGAVVIRHYLP